MATKPIVSIVRCETYDEDAVRSAVLRALQMAELDVFLRATRVLLKPNLLSTRRPEEAVTTHPSIVSALGSLARENLCEVVIGDSPPFAGERAEKYTKLCETTGITAAAQGLGIDLVRFEEHVEELHHPGGRFYRKFEIASAVATADVLVNIPKLKTHGLTKYSGAIKNVFGCIPGVRKGMFHVQAAEDRTVFAQMLVDLFAALKPEINLMDAIIAMEGEGPNAGRPKQVGLILASSDAVALDAVACHIIGLDPMSVDTTRLASEQALGCGDLSAIEIRGESLAGVCVPDFALSSGKNDWTSIPAPLRALLRRQLVPVPEIACAECTGCQDCVTACPVDAISGGKPPAIDLARCIRCYCCHEVCNFSAAKLRMGWLGWAFRRYVEKR